MQNVYTWWHHSMHTTRSPPAWNMCSLCRMMTRTADRQATPVQSTMHETETNTHSAWMSHSTYHEVLAVTTLVDFVNEKFSCKIRLMVVKWEISYVFCVLFKCLGLLLRNMKISVHFHMWQPYLQSKHLLNNHWQSLIVSQAYIVLSHWHISRHFLVSSCMEHVQFVSCDD